MNLSPIKSWSIPMEIFDISPSNSWVTYSSQHWIVVGAHGDLLSTMLIYRWKFELVLYSSSIEEISKKLFDGSQLNSSDGIIFWYSWSSLSVVGCVIIPKFDPYIVIGMSRSYDASIPSFLRELVRSSHIWIQKFWHWFRFISDVSTLFPNHKSCPNSSITTSHE